MTRRLQIVLSSRPRTGPHSASPRLSVWQRFKLVITGLAVTVILVALLLVSLFVGTILAVVLWILIVAMIVGLILKVTLNRARS